MSNRSDSTLTSCLHVLEISRVRVTNAPQSSSVHNKRDGPLQRPQTEGTTPQSAACNYNGRVEEQGVCVGYVNEYVTESKTVFKHGAWS